MTTHIHLHSVIGELPLHEATLHPEATVSVVLRMFNEYPSILSLIVADTHQILGVITRDVFFELLSRPFYEELFKRVQIEELLEEFPVGAILILPHTTSIPSAVKQALTRTGDSFSQPLVVDDGHGYKLLDVFDLLLAHQRISELMNEEMQQLILEKNEFLGIVSHDLKNPLSTIQLITRLMTQQADSLAPEEIREYMSDIEKTSADMFTLIINLLDGLRTGDSMPKFEMVQFEVADMVLRCVSEFQTAAEQKNIVLITDGVQNLKATADKNIAQQAFSNLVSNAVKYSPFATRVWAMCTEQDQYIRIAVRDEGPGLTDDDKAKLFGKFARLSAQPTGGEHSTGLGLSIVKKLVVQMGGDVGCESEYGKGAEFFILLPKA
jgi:signal transduction histidine kinase